MNAQHTPGPWIVIERHHPFKDGSKHHIERTIFTENEHPQLKGRYPIVGQSIGIGMDGEKAIQFTSIEEANARLIAAAPDLFEALNKIASWPEGELGGHMDEPWAAEVARKAIAKVTGVEI